MSLLNRGGRFGILLFVVSLALASQARGDEAPSNRVLLQFAPDGTPARFCQDPAVNLLSTDRPGRGFFLRTFNGNETLDRRLDKIVQEGDTIVVSQTRFPLPRFTFELTRADRYVALKLKRVEGVPKASLTSLHLEIEFNTPKVHALPLDYMTGVEHRDNNFRVDWRYLWHTNPTDPLGAIAFYPAPTDDEEDEAILDIWCAEDLPKPAIKEPWTRERAKQWVDDYYDRYHDLTQMILCPRDEKELYQLTDIAEKLGVKVAYLHTDVWRDEYWPVENSHVNVNKKIFPKGRADLRRYSDDLKRRGMYLLVHYVCAGIGPKDPQRIAGRVDRRLANWGQGTLVEAVDAAAQEMKFQPGPNCQLPYVPSQFANGPYLLWDCFEPNYVRIDDEIIRVNEFADTDKPVWTLRGITRGWGATKSVAHNAGADAVGLVSAYGQNFVPDTDSTLFDEMAREYAEFVNEAGVSWLAYDGYEINAPLSNWGSRKFSDRVARLLDHPVVSDSSSGVPVDSNIECKLNRIKKINQFGYHTVNLSLQLDSHRPASSILDAWFELSADVAKGARRFVILKPEPMFGVTLETIQTHGLIDEMFEAFKLWHEVVPLMSDEQLKTMRSGMTQIGNHMNGKDLFQVRRAGDHFEVVPTRVMVRKDGDVPWRVLQEVGPLGPRQFCRPGDTFPLENPFKAQPASFVLRVRPEVGESAGGQSVERSKGDAAVESYATGVASSRQDPKLDASNEPREIQTARLIQPKAAEIQNQRFAQFAQDGDAVVITAENLRNEPARIERDLPVYSKTFSMTGGRGLAMEITGDGSGAVLLLQLGGRGVRDYVVKIDFTGRRTIVIPCGEAAWADRCWGFREGSDRFDYTEVNWVALGFGVIPPKTNPKIRLENLRTMADVPSKLVRPTLTTGNGTLTIDGEIPSGCYIRYQGGETATVYDCNWRKLNELNVTTKDFVMPAGVADVRVDVPEGTPRPWIELQTIVLDAPMIVPSR